MAASKALQQLSDELHDALWPVLLNQPDNPLLFLCSHFRDRAGITNNPVITAYRTLRLASSQGQHCSRNIMSAYQILADIDGQVASSAWLQLLSMLTEGLPDNLATSLMQVFRVLGRLPPSFIVFHDSTKVCLLLEELAKNQQQDTSSGFMFQLPEAKKLLKRLLLQQDWLQCMDPMAPVQRLRSVHLPRHNEGSHTLLDVSIVEDAATQQADQLVLLALAAREGS